MPDDAVLTQYGRATPGQATFRTRPRFPDEYDVSLLWGRLSAGQAALAVRGRDGDDSDRVRHCTAGALRAEGFVVMNTPTRRNRDHVSVLMPGQLARWDDDMANAFERSMQTGE